MNFNEETYKINLNRRKVRKSRHKTLDTLIEDLRLYFTYDVPNTNFYLFNYTEIILKLLRYRNFKCPTYKNIYIAIGETEQEAIFRAREVEDFFGFGISVLLKDDWLEKESKEKERIILNTIKSGLLDIAELDKLDKDCIVECVNEAQKMGVFAEQTLREKENKKFRFEISSHPIEGKFEHSIYMTLTEKATNEQFRWKFGEEHPIMMLTWMTYLTVTNKEIKTRPSNRSGILEERTTNIIFQIEDILKGNKEKLLATMYKKEQRV